MSKSLEFLRSFDRVQIGREHHAWVCSTARRALKRSCDQDGVTSDWQAISRALRRVDIRTVVMHPMGFPDEFVAWALGSDGGLIMAFVKETFRGQGLGTAVIAEVTDPPERQIPCAIWTDDASSMAAKGFPIRYDMELRTKFRRLAR